VWDQVQGKTAKNQKKSTVVSSKKKWTEMNPIRRRMKKCNPSSGQNSQLVHWWLLVHSGRMKESSTVVPNFKHCFIVYGFQLYLVLWHPYHWIQRIQLYLALWHPYQSISKYSTLSCVMTSTPKHSKYSTLSCVMTSTPKHSKYSTSSKIVTFW